MGERVTRIGKVWTTFLPEKSFSPPAVSLNQLDSTLTSIMREKASENKNTKSKFLKLTSSFFFKLAFWVFSLFKK